MTVRKINGFRAPYRSLTFREGTNLLVKRNGVLYMNGDVSQLGLTISVPPFGFVQQGLTVEVDTTTFVTSPTMEAPYYLTVTAPTPSNMDDLLWQFAKSPRELAETEVIVASYDGLEWRAPQYLTFDGVYNDIDNSNLDFELVGPFSGLLTSLDGGNYVSAPGKLVDQQGLRTRLDASATFAAVTADPDFARVDKVIYRRPDDSKNRIGVRKLLTGSTFAETPQALYNTEYLDSSAVRQNVKVLVASDNTAHVFTAVGYGDAFYLSYTKLSSDRQSELVSDATLLSMTDAKFDVAKDSSDNFHVVYTSGLQIFWQKFDSGGVSLLGPTRLDQQSTQCKSPTVAIDPFDTSVFVAYQCQTAPLVSQIFFRTITLSGTLGVSSKSVAGSISYLVDPSIFVTDDLWVYLAWTDQTAGKVYFRTFDDIGDAIDSSATEVSAATQKIGGGTLTNGAKSPKIVVSDNKVVFVAFLQDKGGASYGLSVWSSDESSAYLQTLISPSENLTAFDFAVESIWNGLHAILAQSGRCDYVRVGGPSDVLFALQLSTSTAGKVSLCQDALGSLVHAWSHAAMTGYSTYDTVAVEHIGPQTPIGYQPITASQLLVTQSLLSQMPSIGDRVVISGSGVGNNGTYTVSLVETDDDAYRLTMTSNFAATENNVTGAFQEPTGNTARFAKSVGDTKAAAYRFEVLSTDVLLSRIVMPEQVILNYVTHGGPTEVKKPYLVGGTDIAIDWGKTLLGSITITGGLKLLNLLDNVVYSVADGSYAMTEGDAMYVLLDGVTTSITPQITPRAMLPWGLPIQVLGVIEDGLFNPLLLSEDMTQLDVGEEDVLGHDLPTPIRERLGITSETSYEAYTSTYVVDANDTYPEAISALDERVEALETNHPDEEEFIGDGVTTTFTLTRFSLNTSNSVFDNEVWVAGRKQRQDPTGGLTRSYRKISTTQIQFVEAPKSGLEIIVRKEGTNYGGPIPPLPGKLWSDPVDHDVLGPDLAYSVGDETHRFAEGHFETTVTERVEARLPVGTVTTLKVMENGELNPILAGKPVSKYSDGKIYLADADLVTGQSFIGVTAETIPSGETGRVVLAGPNIPGVLAGMGFAPGDDIYLSETAGGYTNDPGSYSGGDDSIIRVGVADCGEGVASAAATDLIMMTYVIARP